MASSANKIDETTLEEVKKLLWGSNLKDDVFSRWTQGFVFSEFEKSALVQYEGGPCAVIAPVQGYIIKNALFNENPREDLSAVTDEEAHDLLTTSLGDILQEVSSGSFSVVSLDEQFQTSTNDPQSSNKGNNSDTGESSCKRQKLDQELFHSQLRCVQCGDEETMRRNIKSKMSHYQQSSGVLLYLYSIILTKGVEQIKNEVEDPGTALIDGIHGHGSQSLINLLITGKAVSNVWDNDKEVCGLKLCGVSKRAKIGFLTFMEHLRYCEVGWFLKNPHYPLWLVGSETHLTLLFSKEPHLVISETLESIARHMFNRFDPEGNGFIDSSFLGDILSALDLVSETEYVTIMKDKLDSENLGIITRSSFLEEFYPGETTPEVPKSFTLYHYNGLARSCPDNKVKYLNGQAVIQDELEVQILTDVSPIKMVLLTKWPTIELKWTSDVTPSLN